MLKNDEKELERLQEDKKQESENRIVTCGIFAVYNDNLKELWQVVQNFYPIS